jgi:hypothetical protein
MSIYDKALITILGLSLLFIAVAVPLALRKVPPNIICGFRTRATMANNEIWFSANAYFGRGLIAASFCGASVAICVYLLRPFSPEVFLPVSVLIMAVPSLVATLATQRYVRKLELSSKN